MRPEVEKFKATRMRKSDELAELKEELEDAERKLEEAQGEVDEIESEIHALEKSLEKNPACPRCKLVQTTDPETDAICCPKCGYCEMVADGVPEACNYHRDDVAS